MKVTPAEMVALDGSLLVRTTYVEPADGRARVIGKSTVVLGAMVIVAGTMKSTALAPVTVTLAAASARPGKLAVMTAAPAATPVTGTATVVAPAVILTEAGTVAAAELEELSVKLRPPAGAAADRVSVRFCVLAVLSDRVAGVKLIVAVTLTVCEPVV